MPREAILKSGDAVGLIACSDGVRVENKSKVEELIDVLRSLGLNVVIADTLYRKNSFFSGSPKERAAELNRLFEDKNIKAIFDISGGDAANQILNFIDFSSIPLHPKVFFGISDLSVILNALYKKSGISSYHYKAMNLVSDDSAIQQQRFYKALFTGSNDLFDFQYSYLRGSEMQGRVIGGNIRCFLKLAGTGYFPDFTDKIIFLESLSGRANRIISLFSQLQQIGCFDQCRGIILGHFTELEQHQEFHLVQEYIEEITKDTEMPIVKTNELGHGSNCKCIVIGENIVL